MEHGQLSGRTIVIIGGTSGMGLSAAAACVAAGAQVVALGIDQAVSDVAAGQLGVAGRVITADATDPAAAERAVQEAVDWTGRLDGLYHVAGGSGRRRGDGPLHELTDDGWRYTTDLNLTSVMYSNRAAVRQMIRQGGGGSIVNLSSVLAQSPSPAYFATHAYAAAKAAILGLTRSCASYYAAQNIRFNALLPGLVETPMAKRAAQDEAIMAFIATKQPLDGGRIGQASDLDAAVVFLLSEGSNFITGQALAVDGGWSVSEGQKRRAAP